MPVLSYFVQVNEFISPISYPHPRDHVNWKLVPDLWEFF